MTDDHSHDEFDRRIRALIAATSRDIFSEFNFGHSGPKMRKELRAILERMIYRWMDNLDELNAADDDEDDEGGTGIDAPPAGSA